MRKLATIREIAEIKPIPDADRIEVARIDGWEVVVSKTIFMLAIEWYMSRLTVRCRKRQSMNS